MKTYSDEELIPISALQHCRYCERQFALIHVEQRWVENGYTAAGRVFHHRAHQGRREVRGTLVREFGVQVRSAIYGLYGVTDAVEILFSDRSLSQKVSITPVEYKVGRRKTGSYDRVQLAAQALALEEMTSVPVQRGFIYYGKTKEREEVPIDEALREEVSQLAARIRVLLSGLALPAPDYSGQKCSKCSFFDICLPRQTGRRAAAHRSSALAALLGE